MTSNVLPKILLGQYEATFGTLNNIVNSCPDDVWEGKVANNPFSESAFHALFFADVYLGETVESVKDQDFHRQHRDQFDGYEELEFKTPVKQYSRAFVLKYLQHCRDKAAQALNGTTAEFLAQDTSIEWHDLSRTEMHIYNIRHLQHHCAQLIMRMRLDSDVHIGWYRSGFDGLISPA